MQSVVGGAPDEWRCLLDGPKRVLCMAADAEWVVCGGTFGEIPALFNTPREGVARSLSAPRESP